ncbi:hypothetical protein LZC22_09880, partial [Campylobacter coli]
TLWRSRQRRADRAAAPRAARRAWPGSLAGLLAWPGAALADAPGHASADLLIGLTAGIALACAVACLIAWFYTRAAIYGAGLAFALVEG